MPAAKKFQNAVAPWLLSGAIATLAHACPLAAADWSQTSFVSNAAAASRDPYGASQDSETRLTFSTDRDYGAVVLGGTYRRGSSGAYPGHYPGLATPSQSDSVHLRAGYDFGGSLGYVTLGHEQTQGHAQAENETLGIGVRVSLNRALQLTGELLHHGGNNTAQSSAQTSRQAPTRISIGAAFRF
ncbi:hypothetical protein [Pseudophaeobacter flagellatus]|uniref:hypothetical protein n=1 Tax=Pseudophaeobacter flagellatus TaxID=2899119 RepID=UPI001E34FDF6|nr:hypothetical protein [Pseudophaeobacter flagellatus]MCD9150000.1 hypothetical protein [Pseudophaeobacter flagellatus]